MDSPSNSIDSSLKPFKILIEYRQSAYPSGSSWSNNSESGRDLKNLGREGVREREAKNLEGWQKRSKSKFQELNWEAKDLR